MVIFPLISLAKILSILLIFSKNMLSFLTSLFYFIFSHLCHFLPPTYFGFNLLIFLKFRMESLKFLWKIYFFLKWTFSVANFHLSSSYRFDMLYITQFEILSNFPCDFFELMDYLKVCYLTCNYLYMISFEF